MKAMLKATLAAACLLGAAVPTMAQAPGMDLTFNPRLGLYVPLSDLGDLGGTTGTITSEPSGNFALGLGVELDLALLPVGLRANIDYATGSEVSAEGVSEVADRKVLMLAGDFVFRPLPRLIIIEPYLFAGGGLRQYDFDTEDTTALEDASDPTVHLGGGLELTLGALALNAELGDYISWYEIQDGADSAMQHDLFVSVGVLFSFL